MSNASESQMVSRICQRLGIQDETVMQKSSEYLRLYQSKGGLKTLNDYAKTVMCIDLACTYAGTAFDKDTAIRLSGMRKALYKSNLHFIEKLLNVDRPLTVSELCVQLGCTSLKNFAGQIFEKYKENDCIGKDYNHPQYVTAAVFTACKLKNIKIQKSQFVSMSRLKPSQWKEIEEEFSKFAADCGLKSNKETKVKSVKRDLMAGLEDCGNKRDEDISLKRKEREEQSEEQIEDYETWKNRILEEARNALHNK